jgi:hypothetical protein
MAMENGSSGGSGYFKSVGKVKNVLKDLFTTAGSTSSSKSSWGRKSEAAPAADATATASEHSLSRRDSSSLSPSTGPSMGSGFHTAMATTPNASHGSVAAAPLRGMTPSLAVVRSDAADMDCELLLTRRTASMPLMKPLMTPEVRVRSRRGPMLRSSRVRATSRPNQLRCSTALQRLLGAAQNARSHNRPA